MLSHPGRHVVAKSQEVMVWMANATGMTMISRMEAICFKDLNCYWKQQKVQGLIPRMAGLDMVNSFNNTKFANEEEVYNLIKSDLSKTTGLPVKVDINKLSHYKNQPLNIFEGILLDEIPVEISQYQVTSELLKIDLNNQEQIVEEVLYSNLLKSNCLVTGQPDWASIQISYKGKKIDHRSLLKYLISYLILHYT